MNYASIRKTDISDGKGIGVALFVQGCRLHCSGCFNSETWDFNGGKKFTDDTEKVLFDLANKPYITRLSILGGEPLAPENIKCVQEIVSRFKFIYPDKKVWVYSGRLFEDILEKNKPILSYIDILVDGPYIENLKDLAYPWAGSTNQRVIDVKKTLENNEVILYERLSRDL